MALSTSRFENLALCTCGPTKKWSTTAPPSTKVCRLLNVTLPSENQPLFSLVTHIHSTCENSRTKTKVSDCLETRGKENTSARIFSLFSLLREESPQAHNTRYDNETVWTGRVHTRPPRESWSRLLSVTGPAKPAMQTRVGPREVVLRSHQVQATPLASTRNPTNQQNNTTLFL